MRQSAACEHFQRGRFIAMLQLLWIIPVLFCSESILIRLGQSPDVASLAAAYNRTTAPALFFYFQYQALAKFLQNQCITIPPLVINVMTSILHVAWCSLFVAKLQLGNAGAGYANAVTWTCQWILIALYCLRIAPKLSMSRRDVMLPGKGTFEKWGAYLKVAIPCVLQMSSEWWFWEICALIVGFLGTIPLAAHVAANQIIALCFMPALGIATAASALVGNMLGANRPREAKQYVKVCLVMNFFVWLSIAAVLSFGRQHIANVYVKPGEVSTLMQSLLLIFAFAGFPDTTQHVMSGALRGMGMATAGSVVYLLSYYGLMLPAGYALAFPFGLGVRGVWYAFGIGTSVAVGVFSVFLATLVSEKSLLVRTAPQEGSLEYDDYGPGFGVVASRILGEDNAADGSWFWALYAYGSFTQEWLRSPSSADTTDLDTFPHIAWVACRTAVDPREETERVTRLLGSKPLKS
ncbi:unnamed protein product [Effrenium voratum]|uniref:Multidrug and toxin extrusion protein n=1 Tax=Effrenium voratum TaxID=2562239 RepID=A0AA36JJW9_9DINO|nr:unnamed protein product [Effrenium voratum]